MHLDELDDDDELDELEDSHSQWTSASSPPVFDLIPLCHPCMLQPTNGQCILESHVSLDVALYRQQQLPLPISLLQVVWSAICDEGRQGLE